MTVKFRRVKVRKYNNAYQFILLIEISAMKDRSLKMFFYHYDFLETNNRTVSTQYFSKFSHRYEFYPILVSSQVQSSIRRSVSIVT